MELPVLINANGHTSCSYLGITGVFVGLHGLSQGRHLQRGSRLVDFDITLGDAVCVPVSLTDNQVACTPPTYRPNRNINDTFCHDDTMSLQASSHQYAGLPRPN